MGAPDKVRVQGVYAGFQTCPKGPRIQIMEVLGPVARLFGPLDP